MIFLATETSRCSLTAKVLSEKNHRDRNALRRRQRHFLWVLSFGLSGRSLARRLSEQKKVPRGAGRSARGSVLSDLPGP
jgi:hypothetical protein